MLLRVRLVPLSISLAFFLAVAAAAAENTIIETLRATSDLSTFASYIDRFPEFASRLAKDNITVLAPTNSAIKSFNSTSSVTEDISDATLAYHILNGTYVKFPSGQTQYLPTLLQSSNLSSFTGGQFVVAQGAGNTTTFYSGLQQRSFTTGTAFNCSNGAVHVIDNLLTVPQNFSFTYEESSMFGSSPFVDGKVIDPNATKPQDIDDLDGVTIFLPTQYAFQEIGTVVGNWTRKQMAEVLSYHVVERVILPGLSGALPAGKHATLQGTQLSISSLNGDVYVNSAKVVGKPTWVFEGGVVYTIYGVLNPDNSTLRAADWDNTGIAFADATYTTALAFPGSSLRKSGGLGLGPEVAIGLAVAFAVIWGVAITLFLLWDRLRGRAAPGRRPKDAQIEKGVPLKDMKPAAERMPPDAKQMMPGPP